MRSGFGSLGLTHTDEAPGERGVAGVGWASPDSARPTPAPSPVYGVVETDTGLA